MSTSTLTPAVILVCLVGYILYRQMIQRLVSQRSLLMPVLLGIVLGGIFVASNPTAEAVVAVVVGTIFGALSGLVSGQFMCVWAERLLRPHGTEGQNSRLKPCWKQGHPSANLVLAPLPI